MSESKAAVCAKCGSILVNAKKEITLNGKLPLDGSWNMNHMVCPKCHPELADKQN